MEMKVKMIYLVGIVLVIVAFFVAYFLASMTGLFVSTKPGQYDTFAKCLAQKNATMYGAYWCSHCQNQKKMFGSSFQYVNYVECDPNGENARPDLCSQNNIKGYPTWIINGVTHEGELSLEDLSSFTGCLLSQ
jgi:hypothetical protein